MAFSAVDVISAAKIVFAEFGQPKYQSQMQAQILYQTDLNCFAGS